MKKPEEYVKHQEIHPAKPTHAKHVDDIDVASFIGRATGTEPERPVDAHLLATAARAVGLASPLPPKDPTVKPLPPMGATYPKKPDFADLPFEVVVVERDEARNVLHVEVVSRHSMESEARIRLRSANRAIEHRQRFTAELVRP